MAELKNLFLTALIIVVFGVVASILFPVEITGEVAKTGLTTISVTPTVVGDDRKITITITPGAGGADDYMYIYKYSGDKNLVKNTEKVGHRLYEKNYCPGTRTCRTKKTFDFSLGIDEEGQYYATVQDLKTGYWIKAWFNIKQHKQMKEAPRSITDPVQA